MVHKYCGNTFCMVLPGSVSMIIAIFNSPTNAFYFACTKQEATHVSEVYRSLPNCRPSVWKLLHLNLLMPVIWRRLLVFWESFGPCVEDLFVLHRSCPCTCGGSSSLFLQCCLFLGHFWSLFINDH